MGVTVRERPKGSGTYWIYICYNGKRKAKKIGDKKTAHALSKKLRQNLASGELGLLQKQKPLFGDYASSWLENSKALVKQSTYDLYEMLLRLHIGPALGNKRLDEICISEIKQFIITKYQEGLSVSSLFNMKAVISGIYSSAIEDEIVSLNPVFKIGKFIGKLKKQQPGKENNPLTKEETALLLQTARRYFSGYYPLLLCTLRTGMRIGEVLGLEWGDIDFNGRFIEVRRSLVKGRVETPKNGKMRRVDMSRQLTETLLQLRTDRKKETLKKGWSKVPGRVFLTENGYTIDLDNFRPRVFQKVLEKAGLRRVRIHDLRHTYASLLIAQGESLAYIRDQLGHHSIKVTVDTYGHLVPGANKEAVDRLDDRLQQSATYPQPDSDEAEKKHPASG